MMDRLNLQLIDGVVDNLHVGTLRDRVIERAKGLLISSDEDRNDYQFDSERFDYFACHIGGEFVVGRFRSVRFREGDEVLAVIKRSPSEENVCAALLVKRTNHLHLQMMMDKGVFARFLQPVKFLGLLNLAAFLISLIMFIFIENSLGGFFRSSFMVLIICLFAIFLLMLWDFYLGSGKYEGDFSSSIFKILGFKNPNWLNLRKYSLLYRHGDSLGECVYEVGELLDGAPEPQGSAIA